MAPKKQDCPFRKAHLRQNNRSVSFISRNAVQVLRGRIVSRWLACIPGIRHLCCTSLPVQWPQQKELLYRRNTLHDRKQDMKKFTRSNLMTGFRPKYVWDSTEVAFFGRL